MKETLMNELDRKSLMTTIAIICDGLEYSRVENTDMYNIRSIDNTINYDIDYNKEENSFDTLKSILEYAYNYRNYVIGDIKDDVDALEYTFKFANAVVLDINSEAQELQETKLMNNDFSSQPTVTQLAIFNRILRLDKLTAEIYEKNIPAYSAMVVARYIAESVQQADLFIHYLDLLDYIKVIQILSQIVPCHDNENFLQFMTDMLAVKDVE